MKSFYTYLWLREDGTPYYAGKGRGRRAFTKDGHIASVPDDAERIIIQEWPDEASAFEGERFLIGFYGRIDLGTGCLRNLTDGGEGSSGTICSEETRRRLRSRKNNLGKAHSEETKNRIRVALETYRTPEIRDAFGASQRGKKAPSGRNEKIRQWWTAERRKVHGESQKGRIISEETRAKLKLRKPSFLGKHHSVEARKKMSLAKSNRSQIVGTSLGEMAWLPRPV
jgi:hypothetical protein